MSLRYKGAVISATPPTTTGGETGVASGSWTLEQQMQAQGAGNWPSPPLPKYIEDVFSTYLYTGNGSTQTITNGIDLAGKGGMTWVKSRSNAYYPNIEDTVRGAGNTLTTAATDPNGSVPQSITSFNANGFSLGTTTSFNGSGATFASWTFRKQPKFFDIVTYTGTGSAMTVPHNLGSVPGCIIVKETSAASNWRVYHIGLTSAAYTIQLNQTNAQSSQPSIWNSTAPTSTVFSVGADISVNDVGQTYVAYLFAHNAGGFGLTGTDNVISCGSYTSSTSSQTINLGFEPQWLLVKDATSIGGWTIWDTMRGMSLTSDARLDPDNSNAEVNYSTSYFSPTATGFTDNGGYYGLNGDKIIYIAIRRGPMKVPTDATKVFVPALQSANNTAQTKVYGIVTDAVISKSRNSSGVYTGEWWDRLRGATLANTINNTDFEKTYSTSLIGFDVQNGVRIGTDTSERIQQTCNWVHYAFTRAPSFFDEVCYTGTGSARTINHNLGAVPELMIMKNRSTAGAWYTYVASLGVNEALQLNQNFAQLGFGYWNSTAPTSSVFSIGAGSNNDNGVTYVAYLFATCPGVSKVGSYTGNGSTQTINCGFTGGARFVLIKRTDAVGDWYVYDTARGMTTLTDPYLLLNSTAAESATLGSVTTVTTGFALNAGILAAINTSGASYIYLAIA